MITSIHLTLSRNRRDAGNILFYFSSTNSATVAQGCGCGWLVILFVDLLLFTLFSDSYHGADDVWHYFFLFHRVARRFTKMAERQVEKALEKVGIGESVRSDDSDSISNGRKFGKSTEHMGETLKHNPIADSNFHSFFFHSPFRRIFHSNPNFGNENKNAYRISIHVGIFERRQNGIFF